MKLAIRNIILVTISLHFFTLSGQETTIYQNSDELFQEGMFLIEQEKYLAAQEVFEQMRDIPYQPSDNKSYLSHLTASYYYAYSSYKLGLPNTEKLYIKFLNDFHESSYSKKAYFDLGSYYFAQKKTAEAIKYYKLVDSKDLTREEKVLYQFNLGYSLFKKKDFRAAKPLFSSLKNGTHKYAEPSNYYYGFISFYDADYDAAEKSFESLKSSKLYEKVVPYYLAQIYYMRGNYQKVVDYGTPLLTQKGIKNVEEISHIVGQAYFELGDYAAAVPLLSRYVDEVNKVSKEEMYQLAYAQYKTQAYSSAIENLLSLQILDDAMGQNAMYALADSYLKTNQKSKAKDAFLSASNMEFDAFITELSTFQYAKLAYELDFVSKAIEALTGFLEKYPNSEYRTESAQLLSNALLATKDYGKAIEIIESYNVTGPSADKTFQMVTFFRAIELYNDRKYPESLGLIDKSLSRTVDSDYHGLALFLKGNLMYEIKKYEAAIVNFNSFKQFNIVDNSTLAWASPSLADYYSAYSYFKLKDYSSAATYFEQGINRLTGSTIPNDAKLLKDSYLRNADCLFMIKNYDKAITNYDIVINGKWPGADYALLQESIIFGLQDRIDQKIATLSKLSNQYPNSSYADDASFELGIAYIENNNLSAAVAQFNKFIKKYKDSPMVPEAYLKLGLSNFNLGNDSKALASYKKVVTEYPNSIEAQEALLALKELYVYLGRPNDYIDFVENVAGLNISVTAQDSLLFQVAQETYLSGNCSKAIQSLDEYLELFPTGYGSLNAHYYRADCLFKSNLFNKAYLDYKKVLERGISQHYEKSLVKATYIAYEIIKDYNEANFLYNELYQSAALKSNKEIAVIGLMRTYFKLDRQSDVLIYANQVLQDTDINEEVKVEATFYKAKALFATGKSNDSKLYFQQIVDNQPISVIKAESAYHLALITHENGQYQASLDACFAVKNEYASYEYWVVKTFILIADNYAELDNVFQAKATLESILNNYNGDPKLIDEAQEKLDALKAQELNDSKIDLNSGGSDTIQFDENGNN